MTKISKTKSRTAKITHAYIEGLIEGRCGNERDLRRCPHTRTQAVNEWRAGVTRGLALRHFHQGTEPDKPDVVQELKRIRRNRGE
jgi:hypothetical protein